MSDGWCDQSIEARGGGSGGRTSRPAIIGTKGRNEGAAPAARAQGAAACGIANVLQAICAHWGEGAGAGRQGSKAAMLGDAADTAGTQIAPEATSSKAIRKTATALSSTNRMPPRMAAG